MIKTTMSRTAAMHLAQVAYVRALGAAVKAGTPLADVVPAHYVQVPGAPDMVYARRQAYGVAPMSTAPKGTSDV